MQKILVIFLVILSAVSVFEPICQAEPSSTIKYLMAEPVSMLDYGIQKVNDELRNHVNDLKVGDESPILQAHYLGESNRIQIEARYYGSLGSQSEKTVKTTIEKAIRYIKGKFLLVNPDTGAPTVVVEGDMPFSRFFEHKGYKNPLRPERLGFKLIQITEVEVSFVNTDAKGVAIITGKCDALSTMENISWSKR